MGMNVPIRVNGRSASEKLDGSIVGIDDDHVRPQNFDMNEVGIYFSYQDQVPQIRKKKPTEMVGPLFVDAPLVLGRHIEQVANHRLGLGSRRKGQVSARRSAHIRDARDANEERRGGDNDM